MSSLNNDKEQLTDMQRFVMTNQIRERAENFKMISIVILILSVIIFTILGKDIVKHFIWYWAAFMTLLLLINVVLDIIAARKIKKL